MRRATLAIVVAFAALLPGSARAGDVDTARRLLADGVKLFQRGDYEGARRLFKKAEAEHHAAPIVYNIGLAEERSGRPQAAVDAYEAYVAETGDAGELTSSAVVAIAQIKARSTRLRIETRPAGARIFVDGSTLSDPAPTTLLVPAGHHVVVAQGDGWRAEQELEAKGGGEALTIVMSPPVAPEVVAPAASQAPVVAPEIAHPPVVSPDTDRTPASPESGRPDGFVWGASFALMPYHLQGAPGAGSRNASGTTQAVAGAILEAGHAVTDRFEFLARAFVALGPEAKPTFAWMGGPAVSLRLGSSLWLGATFIGGGIRTRAHDERYGTGLVFGTMAEATLALIATPFGQWTVGVQPGLLLTSDVTDNTAYFVPITFGYRAY